VCVTLLVVAPPSESAGGRSGLRHGGRTNAA
jgi:hypothetical protein